MLWGIDLGGTKIEGAVLPSPESTDPICRIRIDTESAKGYDHILGRIAELVDRMARETGLGRPERLGIGTPGAVDPPTGLMKNCNTTCLNGKPLLADLHKTLGMEVAIANDANCFALAEATLGAAKGARVVFGVIMGTGVGGGVVVRGRALGGLQGIGGEWGHNVIDPNGARCYCGRHGCIETVLCGPSLERFYASRTSERLKLKEIVKRRRAGADPDATATIDRLCEWFGRSIAQVVNILDPDAIVLGGGVGNVDELYTQGRDELRKWVFNTRLDTPLLRPTLGDSAGVFGAAMLVAD